MTQFIDLTGQKFGRLFVIERMANNKHRQSMWLCRCDCGKEKTIWSGDLKSGNTKSCGCLKREKITIANTTHGHSTTIKMSKTYDAWQSMIQRCTNPKSMYYYNYGGRGIAVCKRWRKFENFLKDMGIPKNGLTLDRVNNDKGYCKSNCRWATRKEQNRNKRNNIFVTHKNETRLLLDWAEEFNINYHTLYGRIFILGWSVEKAFTTPVKSH